MDRGMTRGMKAHVSAMLTESDSSISLRVRHFKGSERGKRPCKPISTMIRGLFGLTMKQVRTIAKPLKTCTLGTLSFGQSGPAPRDCANAFRHVVTIAERRNPFSVRLRV